MGKITVLRYGLISGILLCLLFYTPYVLWGSNYDFNLGEAMGYTASFISLATGIVVGIRRRRIREFNGKIPFGPAFQTGFFISAIAAGCVYLFVFLFLELNGAEYMQRLYVHKEKQIMEKYKDKSTAQEKLATMNKDFIDHRTDYQNSEEQGRMISYIVLLFGTIISLSTAGIQQRD
jgi:hypothetical protein